MKTKTIKIIFIICISMSLFACLYTFYVAFIGRCIESGKVVTEIVSMKIAKVEIDTLSNDISYHYMIENKYKIDVYRELPKVFESTGRYFVFIKDIDGNLVFYI